MFLIFGISNGEKKLDFVQTMLCSKCGQFGRFEVYMTYMYLSLFFIPVLRWRKRYYVKSTCCRVVYEIRHELGKKIHSGEAATIREEDLVQINPGNRHTAEQNCVFCGYHLASDYDFCPKCGNKISRF